MKQDNKYRVKVEGYPAQDVSAKDEKEARQLVLDKFKANGIELSKYIWVTTKKL